MTNTQEIQNWYENGKESRWSEPEDFFEQEKFPAALNEVIKHEAKRVLDLGCFTGYIGRPLLDAGVEEYVGVDIQKSLMEMMDNVCQTKNPKMKFIFSPIEEIVFNNEFDAVLMLDVLEHVLKPEKALLAAETALKKDGLMIINLPRDFKNLEPEHLRAFTDDDIKLWFSHKNNYSFQLLRDDKNNDTSFITYRK